MAIRAFLRDVANAKEGMLDAQNKSSTGPCDPASIG